MALANNIEAEWGRMKRPLEQFELSVILALPLSVLREAAGRAPYSRLESFFIKAEKLVRISLLRRWPDANGRVSADEKVKRKRAAKHSCIKRDDACCIFMRTENPQRCHIIPFAASSTKIRTKDLLSTRQIIKGIVGDKHIGLFGKEPGCIDQRWNMVSLNSQLHRLWGQGQLALKCTDVSSVTNSIHSDVAEVVLQLYWLPQRRVKKKEAKAAVAKARTGDVGTGRGRPICISNGDGEAWWNKWSKQYCAGVRAPSKTLPPTGTTAKLRMPLEEAHNMRAMTDLQWACLVIAAMSGATQEPDF